MLTRFSSPEFRNWVPEQVRPITVRRLYQIVGVPCDVQWHMARTALLGQAVCAAFTEQVDCQRVVEALSLHDVGNLVKFKQPFLGTLALNPEFWLVRQVQAQVRWGIDDHFATKKILSWLKVDPSIITLIDAMDYRVIGQQGFISTEARICELCDMLVAPGAFGFEHRLEDMCARYHVPADHPGVALKRDNAQYVFSRMNISEDELLQRVDLSIPALHKWAETMSVTVAPL